MGTNINIASLDIDVEKLIKNTAKTAMAIKDLKEQQDVLDLSNKEALKQFVANAAALKNLEATYKNQQAALSAQIAEEEKLINVKKNVSQAVKQQNDSENAYIQNNKQLIELKKQLSISDDDYEKRLAKINGKIAENNNWLSQNGSAHIKNMTAMEAAKNQMAAGFEQLNIFNGGLKGLKERAEESGGWGKLFSSSLGGITSGLKGMGQAILSNPLGLLLQLVAPIVEQLKNFAPLTNAVEQAMAALSPVIDLATAPIKLLAEGITWVVSGFANLVGSMGQASGEALKLKQAEQELTTAMTLQEAANEKAGQQIDALIKKSKDQSLSEKERATAINDATAIQKQNYAERKALTDAAFNNELQKLVQSKELNAEDISILEEGDAAKVKSLMNSKNISDEELKTLENARVEKLRISGEEITLKEEEAAAIKGLTDEIIDKLKDRNLSEQERLRLIGEASGIETAYYSKRKQELNDQYNAFATTLALTKGISFEEMSMLAKQGDAYKGKAELIKKMSAEELNTLQNLFNEKKRLDSAEATRINEINSAGEETADEIEARRKQRVEKANQIAIAKEKKAEEAARKAIEMQQLELQNFIDTEGEKTKTLEQQLQFIKDVDEKKRKIAQTTFDASKKTHADDLKLLHEKKIIADETLRAQTDATINYTNSQLQLYAAEQDAVKQGQKEMTRATVDAENGRLAIVKKFKEDELSLETNLNIEQVKAKRARNETLTTEESNYLAKITALNTEYNTAVKTNNENFDDQERNRKATEAIADYEIKRANATDDFEQQRLDEEERHRLELEDLDKRLEAKSITEAQYNEFLSIENEKNAKAEEDLEKAKAQHKMDLNMQAFATVGKLLGQNTAAGKAAAIAQTTIDTYLAAQKAYTSQIIVGEPTSIVRGVIAAASAVASGLANVKKIAGTKTPKAEKGALFSIGGQRHSAGGTLFTGADGTQFEAEKGELIGVMNRNAARHFMAFNNAFPAGGGSAPNYFAGGGIVSREVAQQGLNIDELAARIAQANAAIPPPVVAVQDIITQGNSYVRVRDGANF